VTKAEQVIREAEAHMGCPYVYGTWGQKCTPALRKRYANYNPSQREITFKRCQVLRDNDPQPSCAGCKYEGLLAFDCRGFTHFCVQHGAGIDISGGYVGRQWSDPNWDVKGNVSDMIEAVSCVFLADMSHTGLYVLGGNMIHCSGEVKTDTLTGGRKWANFGILKGLYTWQELAKLVKGDFQRMLKKGMSGSDVRDMQIMLNSLGYDCGTADGIFGVKTVEAVKAFQSAEGLTVDGIAGVNTLTLLAARCATPTQPELPEDDDRHDTPISPVALSYADALAVRDALRKALNIIERAIE
jgi:hypothetical protein